MKDCNYVIHLDSPFDIWSPKHEDEFVKPAVEGTKSILKACEKYGVKRLVVTSSTACIVDCWEKTHDYNESDWCTYDDSITAFPKSKYLQEKLVWDYWNSLNPNSRFECVTLCPGFMIGPTLTPESFAAQRWLQTIMDGSMRLVPDLYMTLVDVRDVA